MTLRHGAAPTPTRRSTSGRNTTGTAISRSATGDSIAGPMVVAARRLPPRWRASPMPPPTPCRATPTPHPTAHESVLLPVPGEDRQFERVAQDDTVNGGSLLFRALHGFGDDRGWLLRAYAARTERDTARFGVRRDTADVEYRHWLPLNDANQLIWGVQYDIDARRRATTAPVLLFDPRLAQLEHAQRVRAEHHRTGPGQAVLHDRHQVHRTQLRRLPDAAQRAPVVDAERAPDVVGGGVAPGARALAIRGERPAGVLLRRPWCDHHRHAGRRHRAAGSSRQRRSATGKAAGMGSRVIASRPTANGCSIPRCSTTDYQRLLGVPPTIVGTFTDDASGATWGGDFSVSGRLSDHWRVEGSYSRLRARIDGPVLKFDESSTPEVMAQLHSYWDIGAASSSTRPCTTSAPCRSSRSTPTTAPTSA